MECLVMLKGVPESGRSDELASDTGTPRCVASRVSAQPLNAIASVRIAARVTCNRFTALLEIDGARLVPARPKGSGFNYACEPALQAHRQPQPDVGSDPQYAMRAVIEPLRIGRDMDPHQPEAEVAADHPAEVGLVILYARRRVGDLVVANAGREKGLDADPRRGQWHAEPDRAKDRRLPKLSLRSGGDRRIVGCAQLQVDRHRDQTTSDQAERCRAPVRRRAAVHAVRLGRGDADGQGDRPDSERGATSERVTLPRDVVGRTVVAIERHAGAPLGAVPRRHAEPLGGQWRRKAGDETENQQRLLHKAPSRRLARLWRLSRLVEVAEARSNLPNLLNLPNLHNLLQFS